MWEMLLRAELMEKVCTIIDLPVPHHDNVEELDRYCSIFKGRVDGAYEVGNRNLIFWQTFLAISGKKIPT